MPKEEPKISTRLDDSDYGSFPAVIDITMGEFAFSDRYALHSDGYASCLGVVVAAVNASGVCLAHLDPAADNGTLYKRSLDAMIHRVQATGTTQVDVVFFMDLIGAVKAQRLKRYLKNRSHPEVRTIIDWTYHATSQHYDEAVVMPSELCSAYVCLKPMVDTWEWRTGKRVLQTEDAPAANEIALTLGRARQVSLQGGGGQVETVVGEV